MTLGYGPVEKYGVNLPDGKNYKQYLDEKGHFNNLKFFDDHREIFPNLNLTVQREASRRVVEVGCEWFLDCQGMCPNHAGISLG